MWKINVWQWQWINRIICQLLYIGVRMRCYRFQVHILICTNFFFLILGLFICLFMSVWSEVQVICIRSSWCHCYPVISCFIKIQIGLTYLVPSDPDFTVKEAIKRVSVLCLIITTQCCVSTVYARPCLPVTTHCSVKNSLSSNYKTTPHDNSGTLVF